MIDEAILIERLEKAKDRANRHYNYGNVTAYHNAIDIVEDLAEECKNGWIPCEERLPDTEDWVLVCAVGKNEGVFIAYFEEKTKKWRYDTDEGIYYYVDVIAWQPLPEPYRKED